MQIIYKFGMQSLGIHKFGGGGAKQRYATSSVYKTLFGGGGGGSMFQSGGKGGGSRGDLKKSLVNLPTDKIQFLIYVFANLIAQLGITYYVMMNYAAGIEASGKDGNTSGQSNLTLFILFLIQIGIIMILSLVPMPSWLKFIIFSIFSAIFGFMLSLTRSMVDPNIIKTALVGTIGVFASMFLLGLALLMFGIRLGFKTSMFLFSCLILLIVVEVVLSFMSKYSAYVKGLSIVSLVLFSLYIVFDTNYILSRDYYGDFITASMDYYLDIVNVFLSLVNLENR